MPTKYKVVYFNARGRGEVVRLTLTAAGQKFEDERIEFPDWPAKKPETPLGSMPVLIVDGKEQYPESLAIVRYLAREHGLYGKNNREMTKVDVIMDICLGLAEKGIAAFFQSDEEKKKELMDAFQSKTVPACLGSLEKSISGQSGFAVGSKLTVADLYVYSVMEVFQLIEGLDEFPKVKACCNIVAEDKKIKPYLAARQPTKF